MTLDSVSGDCNSATAPSDAIFRCINKLIDSSEIADKVAYNFFCLLSTKNFEYDSICKAQRKTIKELEKERDSNLEKILSEQERYRLLSIETENLQKKLDTIRNVLQENDINSAKIRLKELKIYSYNINNLSEPMDSQSGTKNHQNISEDSKTRPYVQQSSQHNNGILRRSSRIRANRKSISFLGTNSSHDPKHKEDSGPVFTKSHSTVHQKRTSTESKSSCQNMSFKSSSGILKLLIPGDEIEDVEKSRYLSPPIDRESPESANDRATLSMLRTTSRLTRTHAFISRTYLRNSLCCACGKRILFGKASLKCSVCRLHIHENCRNKLRQRCLPTSQSRTTPPSRFRDLALTPARRHQKPSPTCVKPSLMLSPGCKRATPIVAGVYHGEAIELAGLFPEGQAPQIPAIVIHCVTEVTNRGLSQVGIYRVSGSDKQVKELFEKFMHGKATPSLALIEDIHVICSCLKMFLRCLTEPLVSQALRPTFVTLARSSGLDSNHLHDSVSSLLEKLPAPNRDTLAFLLLHMKNVATSPECRMEAVNLSKVFGPSVVGYSSRNPSPMQTVNDVLDQQAVICMLLALPDSMYSSIVDAGAGSPMQTDEVLQVRANYFTPLGSTTTLHQRPRRHSSRKHWSPHQIVEQKNLGSTKRFFSHILPNNE